MFDWIGQRLFRLIHEHHLVYGSCWEDPRADRLGLEIQSSDAILAITSAGCNVLDYLLEAPSVIDAVDLNFRQNALLQLKIAAIRTLEWNDFFDLFGRGRHPRIREIYFDSLRDHLDEVACRFWDRHWSLWNGKNSFYFRTTSGYFAAWFRFYIDRVVRLGDPIDRLLNAENVDQQIEIYEKELKERIWGPALGYLLKQDAILALSGVPPQQRRQIQKCEPDIQSYLKRQAERIIYHLPIRENYFWRLYLTGAFSEHCAPRYLEASEYHRLRPLVDRVRTHTCSVTKFLREHSGLITKFVLLDHMDWLSGPRSEELMEEWCEIERHSTPATKILWRSLGPRTDFIDSLQIERNGKKVPLGDLLDDDIETCERMWRMERVTAYGSIRLVTWKEIR